MPLSSEPLRSLPALAWLEGDFLESFLPVSAFAHLTTVRRFSEEKICCAFNEWIHGIQAYERLTLGWVRAIEAKPQRHIHAALIAAGELDCKYAARLWQQMVAPHYDEAASVKPYQCGLGGLGYILKQLGSPAEGIRYSDNIAAFAQNCEKSLFPTNSAQRRQQRRIRAQTERVS